MYCVTEYGGFYFTEGNVINHDGYVRLENIGEKQLPEFIKFGKVANFNISGNSQIEDTRGFPKHGYVACAAMANLEKPIGFTGMWMNNEWMWD